MRNGYNGNGMIKEAYRTMYRGMMTKDAGLLNRVMSEDCIMIHMTGLRQSRDEFIDSVVDGTLNYYMVDDEEICVFSEGDTATLTGRSKVDAAVYGGGRHTWRLQLEMFLEYRDGRWQITEARASTYRRKVLKWQGI